MSSPLRVLRTSLWGWIVVAGFILGAPLLLVWALRSVDGVGLRRGLEAAAHDPVGLGVALGAFGAAFVIRALLWSRMIPRLGFSQALSGIHLALGGNHVLPLRLGEPLRIVGAARRSDVSVSLLSASTVGLRLLDMASLVLVAALVAPDALAEIVGSWAILLGVLAASGAVAGIVVSTRYAKRQNEQVRIRPLLLVVGASMAWLLESVVVYQTAQWAGIQPTWTEAIAVACVTVAAQMLAIAPGGLGTYEAAAVAVWLVMGRQAGPALTAALMAHGLKTLYSLVAGSVAVFVPHPGLLGRLRLARSVPGAQVDEPTDGDVVLFFPAYNEQESVAAVLNRVPKTVCGRRVVPLVINDGSTDDTAKIARSHGVDVVDQVPNQGLGAAVRRGLQESVEREAAVVVFADADGEYPPEQLEDLVAPILSGKADYVIGSRFMDGSRSMRPHRWLGNRLLTVLLRFCARERISDGQSGYRAFSMQAASQAEVIHDYNYAQVITLDLLAKGFRYHEVPIDYEFRTTGESFIKVDVYLRRCLPAMWREMNTPADLRVSPQRQMT